MAGKTAASDLIWAYLLHLGYNMWADRDAPEWNLTHVSARPYLRLDKPLWNDILRKLTEARMNMVVIDLGEEVATGVDAGSESDKRWLRKLYARGKE